MKDDYVYTNYNYVIHAGNANTRVAIGVSIGVIVVVIMVLIIVFGVIVPTIMMKCKITPITETLSCK